jgi:hypothetical protein
MSGRLIRSRPVRSVPQPLGLYFRVGRNDQRDLLNLIAAGDAGCFGENPARHFLHQRMH